MLTEPAAGAAAGEYLNRTPSVDGDRHGAEGTFVNADEAVLTAPTQAASLVDFGDSHSNRIAIDHLQGAGRTGGHAGKLLANDTGLQAREDHRRSLHAIIAVRRLDGVGRTGLDTMAAATAGVEEEIFG